MSGKTDPLFEIELSSPDVSLHEAPFVPMKDIDRSETESETSSTSSTSDSGSSVSENETECERCLERENENRVIKEDIERMGAVLKEILQELREIKEQVAQPKTDQAPAREGHSPVNENQFNSFRHNAAQPFYRPYRGSYSRNQRNARGRGNFSNNNRQIRPSVQPVRRPLNKHIRF